MSYMNLIILTQYKSEQKNPLYGCVVGIVCFAKILICDAFSLFNDDACAVKISRLNSKD